MSRQAYDAYWKSSFKTLYETYFQELASEALIGRWQRIDVSTAILVAVTASGSVISGWALWSTQGGRLVWGIVAGIAAIASITHGALRVPGRVKEQEEFRRAFSELRVNIETFRDDLLRIDFEIDQAKEKYDILRKELRQCIGRAHPDIGLTKGLRRKVQQHLNSKLKEKGDIE